MNPNEPKEQNMKGSHLQDLQSMLVAKCVIQHQQTNPHYLYGSCQVLNVQNNWQIVNTNLSRYRSQSLQVLLENAQGDSSQDSRTYKLQEEDFIFCLVRSIEEQARSIENRIYRILSRPKQQLKPIKDQGFKSTSPTI